MTVTTNPPVAGYSVDTVSSVDIIKRVSIAAPNELLYNDTEHNVMISITPIGLSLPVKRTDYRSPYTIHRSQNGFNHNEPGLRNEPYPIHNALTNRIAYGTQCPPDISQIHTFVIIETEVHV